MIPTTITAFCQRQNLEITPIRKVILDHLWQNHTPIKAYDLIEVLRLKAIGSPKPATVYRSIDFLERQGLVHKVHTLNAYIPCHHPGQHTACQLLICDNCNDAKEFCDDDLASLIPLKLAKIGFQPRASVLEVFGTCQQCTKAKTS